ncbi:MAG TPA: 16S rRNA (cytidine(1402)-2'-O)-methyltransferase [Acidimicrobiales bacterium]|nr:16S rRNA (cytidine(1402)-2'-O)-methyltransferase [Acidimicrobiales bacterium]
MPDGRIVLVGTPIGNLGDLSPRAVETLRSADLICCEDTRRTRALLASAGVPAPPLVALHAHNEVAGAARAVGEARGGATVAVVTDAGMPGISDPGERLVAAAVEAGVEVTVVPGPTAAATALVASGLATDRWCFEGFLPRKGSERAARLRAVAADERTTILYESPHRVAATVADLIEHCGPDRRVALARELTKLHEEVWRGRLAGALTRAEEGESRGEWVLVLAGRPPAPEERTDEEIEAALQALLAAGEDRKSAVAAVATRLGVARRRVYDLAVRLKHAPASEDA